MQFRSVSRGHFFYIIFFFFLILFQLFSENKNWSGKSGTLCICCKWLFTSGNLCLHWMWDWKVFPQIIEASGILCLGWSLFPDGCPRYIYWGTQQCSVLRSNSHTSMQTVLWSCYDPPTMYVHTVKGLPEVRLFRFFVFFLALLQMLYSGHLLLKRMLSVYFMFRYIE